MRFSVFFVFVFAIFTVFSPPARAGIWDKFVCWWVPCGGDTDFTRPYLEDGKTPHNIQSANDDWEPQDWIDETRTAQDVMSGLYDAGIITDQGHGWLGREIKIEVGQGFMRLGARDKRRAIRFTDYVSGYTRAVPDAAIPIYHKASGEQIGLYTAEGLQLQ